MRKKTDDHTKEWFEDLFPIWRTFFDLIPSRTTRSEVDALIRYLKLKRGQSFLDCPCGIGRISFPLAQRGIKVTGVDITPSYLAELREKAAALNIPIDLHLCDMRKIKFANQFDAAGNLWTSLGYFQTDEEDMLVLRNIYRALKPGGKFLLHLINRDWIIRHYSKSGWEKTPSAKYFERRHFDLTTSRNTNKTTFYSGKKVTRLHVNIRMYSCHELLIKLAQVGFVDLHAYGGYRKEPIDMDHRNMWLVATKPKRTRSRRRT